MNTSERQEWILKKLNDLGKVRTKDLAHLSGVSSETIRKDLIYLEYKGLVQKKHGGAVSLNSNNVYFDKLKETEVIFQNIGQKALEYLPESGIVFIDAGITALSMAKHIPQTAKNLTLITNSFNTMSHLISQGNPVFFIGGEVSPPTMSTNGLWALNTIGTITFDTVFMGTNGFRLHNGPCAKSFYEAEIKKAILQKSNRCVVMADSSKFKTSSLAAYANWSDVDVLITDSGVPEEYLTEISKQVEVVVV